MYTTYKAFRAFRASSLVTITAFFIEKIKFYKFSEGFKKK